MENYPLMDRIKIKKRGHKNWQCICRNDAPEFFDTLIKISSSEKVNKIIDYGYIPF